MCFTRKFTTLSIFFSVSNSLVKTLSQMGLGDLTDDDCLLFILVPYLSTILAHESTMNIYQVRRHIYKRTSAQESVRGGGGGRGKRTGWQTRAVSVWWKK